MLQVTSAITLGAKIEQTQQKPPSAELIIDGQPTGQWVDGYYLVDAYQCTQGYLLFITDNDCYEEVLRIYLIHGEGKLLDNAWISWDIGVTGVFENVQIQTADSLSFDFFDRTRDLYGTQWVVKLLPKQGFRLPLFCEPLEVHRPFGFKRHFIISAKPRLYPTHKIRLN